ncbi:hypothetical protein CY0110_19327 [Crocosphaera chwakensis CCY0110]|uniref:Uncharacterized protein n=1 Tax=Crocosphaera chwakensis CCY0110 TaxID=391612 RepID=A3IJJ7_9CHRO|nr:hypothetical protein CY0110_19327 [Crocosphaera chwakensis CCY0110]
MANVGWFVAFSSFWHGREKGTVGFN